MWLLRIIAGAALLLVGVGCPAQGTSFQSDRSWSGPQADRIGRVYVGMRKGTAYGPGWTVEAFINQTGAPAERSKVSATEEVLIYRGEKTLYSGTRESNSSAGLEWREIRVRHGQLVDEREAVQVIEYQFREGSDLTCEEYGGRNTLQCSETEIEPIEPLPAMSGEAKLPFDFGCPKNRVEPRQGRRRAMQVDAKAFQEFLIAELRLGSENGNGLEVDAWTPPREPQFMMGMNGSSADPYTTRRCRIGAALSLVAQGNEVGVLSVGICDRQKELTFADVCAAKTSLARVAYELSLDASSATARQIGIPPQQTTLQSGDTVEYFPAIMVGHGIVIMRTSILTPRDSQQNVIVQADLDNACRRLPDLRLCTHTQAVLEKLEMEIIRRFFGASGREREAR